MKGQKIMKKIITILLTLAMIFALCIPALAADKTTVTFDSDINREYKGFKLFDLTTSLKTPDPCGDGNHDEDCYNYAFTINEDFRAAIENATEGATDEAIISELEAANDTKLRTIADAIYNEIKDSNKAITIQNNTAELDQGYWLFADVTTNLQANANSLVMLNTLGKENITVNTKETEIPTVVKKVKDIDDSTDTDITDNAWAETADHDIDDEVIPFQLTATLPTAVENYTTYAVTFHDTLAAGLDYVGGLKVTLDGNDVTDEFTYTANGKSFTLANEDVLALGANGGSTIVVEYNAKLNQNAVVGGAGNENTVYLEFSNNPYNTNSTSTTDVKKAVVFTYQLKVDKVDETGNALAGAGFTLYKKDAETSEYVKVGEELYTDDQTEFVWKGLDDGQYKLEESKVPEGYNKMADKYFTITADHKIEAGNPSVVLTSDFGTVTDGEIYEEIENSTGLVLPSTGAAGTMWIIFGGAMLIIFAGVFMITRKKMSIYED